MEVYVEQVRTRYTANSTGAYILILFSWAAVVIAPLAIGFGVGQFWITSNVLVGRPEITYTGKMVLRAETAEGNALVYVSSDTAMDELEGGLAGSLGTNAPLFAKVATNKAPPTIPIYPTVNLFLNDHDSNGITDGFSFQIAIPVNYTETVISRICVLPEFDYKFNYPTPSLDIQMTAAPLICSSSPSPTTAFEAARVEGDLAFSSATLPESSTYVRYDRVYAASLFDSFTANELALLSPVANAYGLRNFTLEVKDKVTSFGPYSILALSKTNIDPTSTFHQFNFEMVLRVHDSVIRYVPPWSENFKFGWVQYFCIAYVVYYVIDLIKSVLVKQALINTIAIWENRQRSIN